MAKAKPAEKPDLTPDTSPDPVITIDLYGGVFVNGENSNMAVADYVANNPPHAPFVDAAWLATIGKAREDLARSNAKTIEDCNQALDVARKVLKDEFDSVMAEQRNNQESERRATKAALNRHAERIAELETENAALKAGAPVKAAEPAAMGG